MSILTEIYNKNTYFKKYGGSVYCCIISLFSLTLIVVGCNVMKKQKDIQNDWINQRCNPSIFPFAGLINAPTNDSIISYTLQNFTQCVQNEVKTTTSIGFSPINMITGLISQVYYIISQCILSILESFAALKNGISQIFYSIFQIIFNYLVPFQKINLKIMDIFKRGMAMLYTIIMVFITIVGSIKDVFGSTIQILLATYGMLIGLFVALLFFMPLTIVAAIAISVVGLALLSVIVVLTIFYVEVFNGYPASMRSFPGLCFGKNTLLVLQNNTKVKIQDIPLGSILEDGSVVHAIIKISSKNVPMYDLNGVIVSDSHYVSLNKKKEHEKNEWIQVKNHLLSKRVDYFEPYLYCLNTSTKKIIINNMYFLDWDDITLPYYRLLKDNKKMRLLLKGYSKHKKIDYDCFQKNISAVKINDSIKNAKVIGKVKILKKKHIKYNIITDTESFYSNQIKHQDYYDLIRNL